jgi:hypothetical protein
VDLSEPLILRLLDRVEQSLGEPDFRAPPHFRTVSVTLRVLQRSARQPAKIGVGTVWAQCVRDVRRNFVSMSKNIRNHKTAKTDSDCAVKRTALQLRRSYGYKGGLRRGRKKETSPMKGRTHANLLICV